MYTTQNDPVTQIRKEQAEVGKKLSFNEKQRNAYYQKNSYNRNNNKKTFSKNYKPKQPQVPKKETGHEFILKNCIDKQLLVEIYLLDGVEFKKAMVISKDKFTITVDLGDTVNVIFKSAIANINAPKDALTVKEEPKEETEKVAE